MATSLDEQIVIRRRGGGEAPTIYRARKRNAPGERGSSGARSWKVWL